MKMTLAAGEELLQASDGLAPARCGGLLMSLSKPRLAAPGAGLGANTAAAERKSAAASEALCVAQSRMGACGGRQELIGRSGLRAGCAAPGTLIPGGATARRSPCYSWRCGYEVVRSAARATLAEAEAVVGRMGVKYGVGYDLIYTTMRLAPSFGRTRGRLRGAAGHSLEWPACRTRASLVEAEETAETAEFAWRLSELTLRDLHSECARVRRCALDVEAELATLRRLQRTGVSSRAVRRAALKEERARRATVAVVAGVATKLAVVSSRARDLLDRYYWGVWGSARRCRASAREVRVLAEAVREAEWGTWWEDLPGGSTWREAAAAAIGVAAQLGGDACAAGVDCDADGAVGPAGEVSRDGGTSVGECEVGNVGMVVGRQAADGGCAGVGWRSRLGSGITRRLQPGSSDPYEVAWRCLEASWQQMACQRRRTERHEGEVEDAAMCVGAAPVRMRLWQSLKHRRRRRLRRSF